MDAWATFWAWLLVLGLTLFFVLAVVVSIRGFFDVRALLASIRDRIDDGSD